MRGTQTFWSPSVPAGGGGGRQALVQKQGQVSDGGLAKFLLDGGTPSPPGKNTAMCKIFSCKTFAILI